MSHFYRASGPKDTAQACRNSNRKRPTNGAHGAYSGAGYSARLVRWDSLPASLPTIFGDLKAAISGPTVFAGQTGRNLGKRTTWRGRTVGHDPDGPAREIKRWCLQSHGGGRLIPGVLSFSRSQDIDVFHRSQQEIMMATS